MPSKPVFLSHAVEDQPIATSIVDILLCGGMELSSSDIFYTSLHETGISPGADFMTVIKEQIQEPTIVLMLISQNYLIKPFCVAEAGACWAMSHNAIPILVPPVTYSEMEGVLRPRQAELLDVEASWHAILDVFKNAIPGLNPNTSKWSRMLEKFMDEIPALIEAQPKPNRVSRVEHEKVVRELEDAKKEFAEVEAALMDARRRNAALSALKDAGEVAKVDLTLLPPAKQFRKLVSEAKEALRELPHPTRWVMFYNFRGEPLTWTDARRIGIHDDIENDIAKEFVSRDGDDYVGINEDHPLVMEAHEAVSELSYWMNGKDFELGEFSAAYVKEHKISFSIKNQDFWHENQLF